MTKSGALVAPWPRRASRIRATCGLTVLLVVTSLLLTQPAAGSTTISSGDVEPFQVVPATVVSGPVPTTETDFPFAADGFYPQFPLPDGYVVREYFVSGEANIYQFSSTGISLVSPCPASVTGDEKPTCADLPYTTRVLVYAPANPRRFSGTVWVNPLNPTLDYDYSVVWDRAANPSDRADNHFARNNDIFVAFTSKSSAVDALKRVNPARYADLYWPHNGQSTGFNTSALYDGITFDVAAQIGALVKTNGSGSPLNEYQVEHVFETGFSQDGSFTFTQANVFHRLERLPAGKPVFDGYVTQGLFGQQDINFGLTPEGTPPADDPRIKMGPRDAPVIKVNTETELAGFGPFQANVNWRRPDSDSPGDRYRAWEVGGAAHDDSAALIDPTNMTFTGTPYYDYDCDHSGAPNTHPTQYPYRYVANAAYQAMEDWVVRGTAPARVVPLAQTNLTSPSPTTMSRDDLGNPRGGVRTPFLDVPIATYHVIDTPAEAGCHFTGWAEPLSTSTLRRLYPTHGSYVREFAKAARKAVDEGVWLEYDAREAMRAARKADVP